MKSPDDSEIVFTPEFVIFRLSIPWGGDKQDMSSRCMSCILKNFDVMLFDGSDSKNKGDGGY